MMHVHPFSGDVGSVFAVPAAMHIEAMTQGDAHLDVMPGFVATVRRSRRCYRMSVMVEQIAFDQRIGGHMGDGVSKAVVLIVMDEIMVHMMVLAILQKMEA